MVWDSTRRTFVTGTLAAAGAFAGRAVSPAYTQAFRDEPARQHALPDMLGYMVRTLGPPRSADLVGDAEAALYKGRVPPRLIKFWQEQGRGSYFDGMYWICDPAPFRDVLNLVFKDDPEFVSADMTAVTYSAFGHVKIWDRRRANLSLDFAHSTVFCPPESSHIDANSGERFPDDYMISTTVGLVTSQFLPSELNFNQAARDRLGPLAPGEIYGFFPALQLGGAYAVENLRRVKAAEHLMLLAQLAPLHLTALSPPESPHFPYGRQQISRQIGHEK